MCLTPFTTAPAPCRSDLVTRTADSFARAPMPIAAFDHVPLQPPDAIFALTAGYAADKSDKKVNLGVGAYRDNHGKPFVLPVVRKVSKQEESRSGVVQDPNKPIDGGNSTCCPLIRWPQSMFGVACGGAELACGATPAPGHKSIAA